MKLHKVEHESGGESRQTTEYSRAEYLDEQGVQRVWSTLAKQELGGEEVDSDDHELCRVELGGWWVNDPEFDCDDLERAVGQVYGNQWYYAILNTEASADSGAWKLKATLANDRWNTGPFWVPKSLVDAIFAAGEPEDGDKVRVRRHAAYPDQNEVPFDGDPDWEAAIEAASERAERVLNETLPIDDEAHGMLTKDEQSAVASAVVGNKREYERYVDHEVGADEDTLLMNIASEAVARTNHDYES